MFVLVILCDVICFADVMTNNVHMMSPACTCPIGLNAPPRYTR